MKVYNSFNELFGVCCASCDLSVFNYCSLPNQKQTRVKSFITYFGIDDDDPTVLEIGMGGGTYQYLIGNAAVAETLCNQLAKEYNPGRFFSQHIKKEYQCRVVEPPVRGSLEAQSKLNYTIEPTDVDYGPSFIQPNIGKGADISTPQVWSKADFAID